MITITYSMLVSFLALILSVIAVIVAIHRKPKPEASANDFINSLDFPLRDFVETDLSELPQDHAASTLITMRKSFRKSLQRLDND